MSFIGGIIRYFVERGAKDKDYAHLIHRLETDREAVVARLQAGRDTPRSRNVAAHVIGIERWSQRRLRGLLGEPPISDEYDGYRPSTDLTLAALCEEFVATRAETIALANRLQAAHITVRQTAPHNDLGDVTVGGWFTYIASHGVRESKMIW